ncbi:endonuclease/exonuclease/phosphatase family protein [Urechidicola sp. KH5]
MSYNIRLDTPSDGENAWPKRKEALATQIAEVNPTILGIQEGMPHQVEFLSKKLNNYKRIGFGRDGGNLGEYSAIYFNSKEVELLKENTFWLSTTPEKPSKSWDAAYPRICTYGLFKNKETNKFFWVFNTHFDHIGQQSRLKSTSIILNKIEELNDDDYPVFVIGDLNVTPQNEVIDLFNQKLIDTYEASMETPKGSFGTFNGFDTTTPAINRIDYILADPAKNIEIVSYEVLSDKIQNKFLSDHFAVLTKIMLHDK